MKKFIFTLALAFIFSFGITTAANDTVSSDEAMACTCTQADINNDGVVGSYDYMRFMQSFGSTVETGLEPWAPFDFNEDNIINTSDLLCFLSYYGTTC